MSVDARFALSRPEGFRLAVDLSLPGRGVSALFGPSGCGKTTLLRCLAGLEPDATGRLVVNGDTWQDDARRVPPHRRAVGYVFQESRLFPHLSVRGNLDYGRRRAGTLHDADGWQRIVALLGIDPLLERRPEGLSGGEQQRVAIALALMTRPRLLLMDEPLAAIDVARRGEILPYLERLHDELDLPVVYVSHAPDEVARLADHLVVLDGGRVAASGPLAEVLASNDLAARLGEDAGVVIEAVIAEVDPRWHLARVELGAGSLWVRDHGHPRGRRVRLRLLARDVSLALSPPEGTSIANGLPAVVRTLSDAAHPAIVTVRLDLAGLPLLARITRRSASELGLVPGLRVWAQMKAAAVLG